MHLKCTCFTYKQTTKWLFGPKKHGFYKIKLIRLIKFITKTRRNLCVLKFLFWSRDHLLNS